MKIIRLFLGASHRLGCLLAVLLLAGCATGFKDTSRTFDTVVLDAGHGGHDSGAIGQGGLREKGVALDVTKRVQIKLQAAGFDTVMTRSDDRYIPLPNRAAAVNAQKNAVFVSIHFNHSRSRRVSGVETYYSHPSSRPLAQRIQRNLSTVGSNRGVKTANFHVLRNSMRPAVLVECGFVSNRSEASLASRAEHRDRLASLIADAIISTRPGKARAVLASRPVPVDQEASSGEAL